MRQFSSALLAVHPFNKNFKIWLIMVGVMVKLISVNLLANNRTQNAYPKLKRATNSKLLAKKFSL